MSKKKLATPDSFPLDRWEPEVTKDPVTIGGDGIPSDGDILFWMFIGFLVSIPFVAIVTYLLVRQ